MKRRDFIKSFAAASAAVPLASALAGVSGSEKVIETFHMGDVAKEADNSGWINFESGDGVNLNDMYFESTPQYKGNRNIFNELNYSNKYYYFLCYDRHQLEYFVKENIDYFKIRGIKTTQVRAVTRQQDLSGLSTGTQLIGLFDYWRTASQEVMGMIMTRDMTIITPNVFFGTSGL